ncbi:hypothetical protein HK101_011490 [Irineochytrium annulatum]|nr:hypothetical protein HK101_011490 [Irineochytrium annulatum]
MPPVNPNPNDNDSAPDPDPASCGRPVITVAFRVDPAAADDHTVSVILSCFPDPAAKLRALVDAVLDIFVGEDDEQTDGDPGVRRRAAFPRSLTLVLGKGDADAPVTIAGDKGSGGVEIRLPTGRVASLASDNGDGEPAASRLGRMVCDGVCRALGRGGAAGAATAPGSFWDGVEAVVRRRCRVDAWDEGPRVWDGVGDDVAGRGPFAEGDAIASGWFVEFAEGRVKGFVARCLRMMAASGGWTTEGLKSVSPDGGIEKLWREFVESSRRMMPVPRVRFVNEDPKGDEASLLKLISNPVAEIESISTKLLRLLYDSPADVPEVRTLVFRLKPFDGVAQTIGGPARTELHLSSNFVESYDGSSRAREEMVGVLWHELVHVYQHTNGAPSWFLEGLGDLIRMRVGFAPPHWAKRHKRPRKGQGYQDGFDLSARFLAFMEEQRDIPLEGFARKINLTLRTKEWDDGGWVRDLAGGRTFPELWAEYLDYLTPPPTNPTDAYPIPILTVVNDDETSKGGALFEKIFPRSTARAVLATIVIDVLSFLYPNPRTCPRGRVRSLTIYARDMDGVAYCTGDANKEIHLSTQHLLNQGSKPDAALAECLGVLTHEAVHAFQFDAGQTAPGGLIEGVADRVRLACGRGPAHWRRAARGKKWDAGYDTTAFFLQWVERENPAFTVELNARCGVEGWEWDEEVVRELNKKGLGIRELWAEYRASLEDEEGPGKGPRDEKGWPVPVMIVDNRELDEEPDLPAVFGSVLDADAASELWHSTSLAVQRQLYTDAGVATLAPGHIKTLTLIVRPMDGVAYCTGDDAKEIHLSTTYLRKKGKGAALLDEIRGVLAHELTHAWQLWADGAPQGLTEGIADWVRLQLGYAPPHWKRAKGGGWDGGYDKTAYFLEWVEQEVGEGFVRRVNESMVDGWDVGVFKVWTGRTVEQLYEEYQASLDN